MATHQILPIAVHWLRAGMPAASTHMRTALYGTAQSLGTYTAEGSDIVFYDVGTCLLEPPGSPAAILAAAGKPDATCIVLCIARPSDLCDCGVHKLAESTECVCCAIDADDAWYQEQEQEQEPEEDYEDDGEDYSICANCFRTFEGDGFHGFCGPTCAAVKRGTVCHCCYE